MKKLIAVLVALSLFVLPVFASDVYTLDEGMEWLCEEHHVLVYEDDICPLCYQMYMPSTLALGNTQTAIGYIGMNGASNLTYQSSFVRFSYDASTGAYNSTISEYIASQPILLLMFDIPNLYNNDGSYAKPTDYPYYILEFDIESTADFSMSDNLTELQFGVTLGSDNFFLTQYQKKIQFSEVSDGHFQVILDGESVRVDQRLYYVGLSGTWSAGDTISLSDISLKSTNDIEGDTPSVTPPGPMSPPTDSDKWQDEQFQGAVNPELNDKLTDANTKIEQIEEIEGSVIDQLDEHYTQVSPDNIEFNSNLISSMRWIGSQFDNCLDSIDSYGLMGVITLPMFVGLCLLIIGRGGQVMAATKLHIQSKRRDDNA